MGFFSSIGSLFSRLFDAILKVLKKVLEVLMKIMPIVLAVVGILVGVGPLIAGLFPALGGIISTGLGYVFSAVKTGASLLLSADTWAAVGSVATNLVVGAAPILGALAPIAAPFIAEKLGLVDSSSSSSMSFFWILVVMAVLFFFFKKKDTVRYVALPMEGNIA